MEEENERQRKTIQKMEKKLSKSDTMRHSMKEAFVVQDKEISRLSSSLKVEAEKVTKLTQDITHWKGSASDVSKSLVLIENERDELKRDMDDMQAKLMKRNFKLQAEIADLKKAKGMYEKELKELREMMIDTDKKVTWTLKEKRKSSSGV